MNILIGLSYEVILAGNIGIVFIFPQILGTWIPLSINTQDIWQKDLDDSLNAKLWQHIWGSVYKAVWETRLQQIQVNILPRTCWSTSRWGFRQILHFGNAENAELLFFVTKFGSVIYLKPNSFLSTVGLWVGNTRNSTLSTK